MSWRGGNARYLDALTPGLRDHFVYWLRNDVGEVIYVGCTRRPEMRWTEHAQSQPRMIDETAHRYMAGPYAYAIARRIERREQFLHRPKYVVNIPRRVAS